MKPKKVSTQHPTTGIARVLCSLWVKVHQYTTALNNVVHMLGAEIQRKKSLGRFKEKHTVLCIKKSLVFLKGSKTFDIRI